MSQYELLMGNKDIYEQIAQIYAEAGDVYMAQFYFNAAYGYKLKADKLTLEQADGF